MIWFILLFIAVVIPLVTFVMAIIALRRISRLQTRLDEAFGKTETSTGPVWPDPVPLRGDADTADTAESDEQLPRETNKADGEAEETEPTEETAQAARTGADADDKVSSEQIPPEETATGQTKQEDFESRLGGRWTTLLGGIALALGMVFLVRHSIEAGWFGPGARILMGVFFSAALFAAGELLRSSDRRNNLPVYLNSDVPSILTAAGALGAFATIYAAHALYGFIGPAIAFTGLAIVGLAALFLSAVHGPALAALGTLGAYVAPLLVSSTEPSPVPLAMHIVVVTASAMGLARLRGWTWLALCAAIASSLWAMLFVSLDTPVTGIAGMVMLLALAIVFLVTYGAEAPETIETEAVEDEDETADENRTVSAAIPVGVPVYAILLSFGLLTLAFAVHLALNKALPETPTALLLSLAIIGGAIYWTNLTPALISATSITVLAVIASDLDPKIVDGLTTGWDIRNYLVPPDTGAFIRNAILLAVPPSLLATWGSWQQAQIRAGIAGRFASAATTIALLSLLFTYLVITPFESSLVFGFAGLVIAGIMIFATDLFIRRDPGNPLASAPAAFAVGAVASVSFSIAVSLDKAWMPLAFCLASLGIVGIYRYRPLTILPWLALLSAILGGIALWFSMPFALPQVSGTYLFNELLTLLGLPAATLLFAGEMLRRNTGGIVPPALTAIGLAISGLFVAFEIVHLVNAGDLASARQSLAETAAHALAALAFAWGLQRIAMRTGTDIYEKASYVAAAISVAVILSGLMFLYNPYLTGVPVGNGLVFNMLLPAYLMTGLAAGWVALFSRGIKPRWYSLMYAALGGLLLFSYASLMLRKAFQGASLGWLRNTTDLEFWLYSPLWLVLGALTLMLGLKLRSLPVRAASGVLIALTIFKVFLMDMSELTGVLRAFSFIGLGISLMVIGRFYQRILLRNRGSEARPGQEEAPET